MKETIKYDKKDAVVFCDESGHVIIRGELESVLALYGALGTAIKDQACTTDNDKKAFNKCIEILLSDEPAKTVHNEVLNKLDELIKELDKISKED